ncbi:MAG: DUF4340 domain-containing protein [Sedimentisphaerales bacterium]|nr:DUF4340 domain-containing protein [Sedimentisphaerales bacterium]
MSNRNLLILGLIAGITVFLAVLLSGISNRPQEATTMAASYLIQGLDPDQITKITVGTGSEGELVSLTRRGANFVVSNKDNYPALVSEINKLITACLDIKTSELYTNNPENFKDLGVEEDTGRIIVKFYKSAPAKPGEDGSLLTGVVIGKQKDKGGLGYIRRVDDNKVYVMASQIPWIKKRPVDYIDQQLTSVKREDIEFVTVSGPNDSYTLKPGIGEKGVLLDNLPEGKKLKETVANGVFTALADLRFDDVNSEASRKDLKFDSKFVCRLKDSTLYTIPLAKQDNNWFAKCAATFMDITPVTKTQGQVESEEELKKKEIKLLARDAAEEFSEKHQGWVYQISRYQAENLTKPLSELLEDISPPDEPNGVD